jgi:hypothetical protein
MMIQQYSMILIINFDSLSFWASLFLKFIWLDLIGGIDCFA